MMTVSKQIVWGYSAMTQSFFSPYISGCERLANGNTQITSGMYGHMFEVTPAGNLVWEYESPIMAGNYITDTLGLDQNGVPIIGGAGFTQNSVFRSHRYAPDFPGLAGKSLISQGTITTARHIHRLWIHRRRDYQRWWRSSRRHWWSGRRRRILIYSVIGVPSPKHGGGFITLNTNSAVTGSPLSRPRRLFFTIAECSLRDMRIGRRF